MRQPIVVQVNAFISEPIHLDPPLAPGERMWQDIALDERGNGTFTVYFSPGQFVEVGDSLPALGDDDLSGPGFAGFYSKEGR